MGKATAKIIGDGPACGMYGGPRPYRTPGEWGHATACPSTRYAYVCRTVGGQGIAERTCEGCGFRSARDVAPCVKRARFDAAGWTAWWTRVEAAEERRFAEEGARL